MTDLLLIFPVLLFSLSVHEMAHAWTAKMGGDRTAEQEGRITLNPLSHIDPFGTILLPLMLSFAGAPPFGWARPVPFREANLRKPIWVVWIAVAGPASNILIALATAIVVKASFYFGGSGARMAFEMAMIKTAGVSMSLYKLAWIAMTLNIALAVFNMIPVPPLDGSKLIYHFYIRKRPHTYQLWNAMNMFGILIVWFMLSIPGLKGIFGALYYYPLAALGWFLNL